MNGLQNKHDQQSFNIIKYCKINSMACTLFNDNNNDNIFTKFSFMNGLQIKHI